MVFVPDSPVVADVVPSPNHGERLGGPPDMLILHYTGMPSAADALARLVASDSGVSAHYLVFEDSRITQCVAEARRAWHAGVSSWEGESDINSRSIGIEIANPGHEHGYADFPAPQVAAVIALCRDILARRAIAPHRVLAHSDVAPLRKDDPGEKFPWRALHEAGIGLWVAPAPLDLTGPVLAAGDAGPDVAALQEALARFGYGIEQNGAFDPLTAAVVRAFQRHFRPTRVDGRADASTRRTLADLLKARSLDPIL
jgi:N-acetylmuramoyl-L-alanine amidase